MAKKAEALTRAELAKMKIGERAKLAGVKPKYMVMAHWTPRSMRKGRGG